MIALEAQLAVLCLRIQEGPHSSAEAAPAAEDAAAKKKDKKKGKGAGDITLTLLDFIKPMRHLNPRIDSLGG